MQHVCPAFCASVDPVDFSQVFLAHVDWVGDCDIVGDFGIPERLIA